MTVETLHAVGRDMVADVAWSVIIGSGILAGLSVATSRSLRRGSLAGAGRKRPTILILSSLATALGPLAFLSFQDLRRDGRLRALAAVPEAKHIPERATAQVLSFGITATPSCSDPVRCFGEASGLHWSAGPLLWFIRLGTSAMLFLAGGESATTGGSRRERLCLFFAMYFYILAVFSRFPEKVERALCYMHIFPINGAG